MASFFHPEFVDSLELNSSIPRVIPRSSRTQSESATGIISTFWLKCTCVRSEASDDAELSGSVSSEVKLRGVRGASVESSLAATAANDDAHPQQVGPSPYSPLPSEWVSLSSS